VDWNYGNQTPRIIQFAPGTKFTNANPWGAGPAMWRATQDGEAARVLQYPANDLVAIKEAPGADEILTDDSTIVIIGPDPANS
jgi:hypothetical protein